MMRFSLYGLLALLFVATTGCGAVSRPYPQARHFALDVERPAAGSPAADDLVLMIRRLGISTGFEAPTFVYALGDSSYESDLYNQFFSPPAALVTEQVREWFAGAGLFTAVVQLSSHALPTHLVEGHVVRIYGDYADPDTPAAVLELELFLLDARSVSPSIVFRADYPVREPIADTSAQSLVRGFESALATVLTRFEGDVRREIERAGNKGQ